MENQKIINLWDKIDTDSKHFAAKKWYIINDYAEAYILIDVIIRADVANANTRLALKNCAPFTKCNLEINDEHVDTAENLDITVPMYNLIEYSRFISNSLSIYMR